MEYRKEITVTPLGSVNVSVIALDGRDVGSDTFIGMFNTNRSVERRCKKAHKWADERIKVCKRQEAGITKLEL